MIEEPRKKQFWDALTHMKVMIGKSQVRVEDAQHLFNMGFKLYLTFEDMEKGRAKWRTRAEVAEAKLKDASP